MKKVLVLSLVGLSLTGCSMLGLNDRSLDYKNAKALKPLEVPEGMLMRKETPFYPAPVVEERALENAPSYENSRGNRYQLPRPTSEVSTSTAPTASTQLASLRPHFIYDGNKNPLLQIAGDTQQIWRYTLATVSSLNYKTTMQAKRTSAIIEKDDKQYMLHLSQVGATHALALYELNGNFAPQDVANEVLTQIYQNWPV